MHTKKERADQLVFLQGLTDSREKAKRLIMAGEVAHLQNEKEVPVDKPGHLYTLDSVFVLKEMRQYVSRGAYKLLTLLEATHLDVKGSVCLDCGASTGGFTDLLLQRGARRVYAVDVGHNQLHEKLRADPRVISMEGVNLRTAPKDLIPEAIDLLTIDVSFISLTLLLPTCLQWLKPNALLALLIKPQFELGPHETVKGIVRDPKDQARAVAKVAEFCTDSLNLTQRYLLPSALKGTKGNQEYLALFERNDAATND